MFAAVHRLTIFAIEANGAAIGRRVLQLLI